MKIKKTLLPMFLGLVFVTSLFGQDNWERGKDLYELKCGRCHVAYAPQKYSLEEWETIVTDKGPQSGLSEENEALIMSYLEREAGRGLIGKLPTSPVVAGYMYTEFFSGPAITDTFDIHYLNLMIAGRLHEMVSYRAEFEFEHGGGEDEPPFIEWAYLDFRPLNNTGVRIGAILAPFNRFDDFHAPLENFLVTRPQMSREIGVSAWKEVGVNLYGNVLLNRNFYINYDAYVINGLGAGSRLRNSRQYRDNNDAKSFGFRLSGVYTDRWELGASFYRGMWDDGGEQSLSMFGFHFLGQIENFSLYAEYSKAKSENPVPLEDGDMDGFFVQLSYLFGGMFRPTVRYGTLNYLDLGDQLGRTPTDFDQNRLSFGGNFYLTSGIVFKVEYGIVMEGARKDPVDNNLLALQAAIRF